MRLTRLMMALALFLAAGCSRSPRANFYTLTAAAPLPSTELRRAPSLAIDAVTLPEFVDRPQLVISGSDNRVEILETHQWAESLKSAIPRILADDISRQLGLDMVTAYPQHAGSSADYRLSVDFQVFEATATEVSVDAFWTLQPEKGERLSGRSRVKEAHSGGYDSVVAAYSRALAGVSGDITREMGRLLLK